MGIEMPWCAILGMGSIAVMVACGDGVREKGGSFAFEVVRLYGSAELGADSLDLDPLSRSAGGGVLGRVFGIVQGSDSTVYVLERDWRKIVAFRPDGMVKGVLLGGAGEGPGEFRLPVHMAVLSDDRLAVLDFELRRVSLFHPVRGFESSFRIDVHNPMRIVADRERIWVSRLVGPGEAGNRAFAFDLEGRLIGAAPPVREEDADFGGNVNIVTTPDGAILLPSPRPGLWELVSGDQRLVQGEELFQNLLPPRVERGPGMTTVGTPEATTLAVAPMASGHTVVWYLTGENDDSGMLMRGTERNHFGIFSPAGRYLGDAWLPEELELAPTGGHLHASPVTGNLYLSALAPHPVVAELRLVSNHPAERLEH